MRLSDSLPFPPDEELQAFLDEYEATNGRMYQDSSRPDATVGSSKLSPIRPKYYGRKPSNNLRSKRALRLMTQAALAAKTGTTKRSIIAIENGHRTPSVYMAIAIAEALEVTVEEIFQLAPLTPVKPSKY